MRDEQEKYYESLVRFVYPKDHETMAGKCIIHYIGWNIKWDEPLDINSDRICKRHSNKFGPHRHRRKEPVEIVSEIANDFNVNAQSQEDIDLQRAIAASLGQM